MGVRLRRILVSLATAAHAPHALLTVQDIADRCGVSRASAQRLLARWAARGLVVQRSRPAGEGRWRTLVSEADWQRWVSGQQEAA